MATLHVRNVPEALYEALRTRAAANGRSIGAETIQLLEQELAVERARRGFLPGRRRRPAEHGLFTRFTERGRAAVAAAREQARALGHDHVGTGHLLLGLLAAGAGPGAEALAALGLTLERGREEVGRRVPAGTEERPGRIPFEPGAKKALELALREALALHHDYIGTEHLLLGIVREGEGVGAEVVRGVEPDAGKVRACVLRALGPTVELRPPADLPPFLVVELDGPPSAWEERLNDAAARGYELVEVAGERAIFRRD